MSLLNKNNTIFNTVVCDTLDVDVNFIMWLLKYSKRAYKYCGDISWSWGYVYFKLGIEEECGECAGVLKRVLRGDYNVLENETSLVDDLAEELSDVLWYTAMLNLQAFCKEFGYNKLNFNVKQEEMFIKYMSKFDSTRMMFTPSPLVDYIFNINSFKFTDLVVPEVVSKKALNMCGYIKTIAGAIEKDLINIADLNLKKMALRYDV